MNKMGKKRIGMVKRVLALGVLFMVAPLLMANEVSAVWTRLYERAVTYPQKQQIMLNILEQHNRELIPVLTEALDVEVRNLRNTSNITEKSMQIDLMKMVVKELGALKANEAREVLFETVRNVDDPFLKGEAIISLGKVGARQYVGDLALMLRNINLNAETGNDRREGEVLAYALVMALERLRDDAGYSPVFFASRGWYSPLSGVKERAEEALEVMVDNPTEQLLEILLNETDYEDKLAVLHAEEKSSAPGTAKAELAAAGLTEGLKYSPNNLSEQRILKEIRLFSLGMLKKYPRPRNMDIVARMDRMITLYRANRVFDEDEMLTLIDVMGRYEGQEDVAKSLSSLLRYYNQRRDVEPPDSYRIVRALIQALGSIGHISGLEELTFITYSSFWEGSIQREAKAAIEKIR